MKNNIKRILALITVILIVCFVIATFIIACIDFPGKETVFFGCILGVIFLPIFAWLFLWMYSVLTNKKNIASFRSEEMEETMRKADEIRSLREQGNAEQVNNESNE